MMILPSKVAFIAPLEESRVTSDANTRENFGYATTRRLDSIEIARHFMSRFQPEPIRETQVMNIENFESLIELLLDRRPFQPFTIELENGQRFEVDHRHALAIQQGMALAWPPGGAPLWFDHQSVTSILGDTANTPTSE